MAVPRHTSDAKDFPLIDEDIDPENGGQSLIVADAQVANFEGKPVTRRLHAGRRLGHAFAADHHLYHVPSGEVGDISLVHAGSDVRFGLLAGRFVGEAALLRFYVLHCVGFPLIAATLMAVHFWRVRKDGGISGPM